MSDLLGVGTLRGVELTSVAEAVFVFVPLFSSFSLPSRSPPLPVRVASWRLDLSGKLNSTKEPQGEIEGEIPQPVVFLTITKQQQMPAVCVLVSLSLILVHDSFDSASKSTPCVVIGAFIYLW